MYDTEKAVALQAVHRASVLTKDVMKSIASFSKDDASPVTIADFAAQALIICAIKHHFPDDGFIAEESADMLRADGAAADHAWQIIQDVASIEQENKLPQELHIPSSREEMLDCIDLGCTKDEPKSGRVWILDPVDGTATFMKSQQYAVCLCLTVGGVERVAVFGCPNLLTFSNMLEEDLTDKNHYGVVVSAMEGAGCEFQYMRREKISGTLDTTRPVELGIQNFRFIISAKSKSADNDLIARICKSFGVTKEPLELWSTQMKYVALALGAADAMLVIPRELSYRSYVWDHAGGQLIYRESGGKITDIYGQPFEFGTGRRFQDNVGLVAADPAVHEQVLSAAKQAVDQREQNQTGK